ncbi:unnamed protein product [Meloidogyne enterolobii]|uniref:Uncharacterized protein n=1 Tax=Meloidogyne enterolobii TaxID=390850 RepID=A0ACB0YHR2_MELEN
MNEMERQNNERFDDIEARLDKLRKFTSKGKKFFKIVLIVYCIFVCFYIFCRVYYNI